MSILDHYASLRGAGVLDQERADAIVAAATPHAAALLPTGTVTRATARIVSPAQAIGGSVIPAWPVLHPDGSVTIQFVADWGAMLAAWRSLVAPSDDPALDVDALIASGDRLWVGIANDVLQMYVPNPPAGTYSMVRHHALMLVAATLWLGHERADLWRRAHAAAARSFLATLGDRPLWDAVNAAERGLDMLLQDQRARQTAPDVLRWLDADADAARGYASYLGAASLGVAALLGTRPVQTDPTEWTRNLVQRQHADPDFNREQIESFAGSASGR
ncbi:MAG: hypothetical protein U0821_12020 [Chloroflexota bacterium]